MLSAANSALVAGSGVEQHMKMQLIRVTRAFNFEGAPVAKDKEIEVALQFAIELRTANKAVFVDPKPVAISPAKADEKPEPKVELKLKAAKPQEGAKHVSG